MRVHGIELGPPSPLSERLHVTFVASDTEQRQLPSVSRWSRTPAFPDCSQLHAGEARPQVNVFKGPSSTHLPLMEWRFYCGHSPREHRTLMVSPPQEAAAPHHTTQRELTLVLHSADCLAPDSASQRSACHPTQPQVHSPSSEIFIWKESRLQKQSFLFLPQGSHFICKKHGEDQEGSGQSRE